MYRLIIIFMSITIIMGCMKEKPEAQTQIQTQIQETNTARDQFEKAWSKDKYPNLTPWPKNEIINIVGQPINRILANDMEPPFIKASVPTHVMTFQLSTGTWFVHMDKKTKESMGTVLGGRDLVFDCKPIAMRTYKNGTQVKHCIMTFLEFCPCTGKWKK